MARIARSLDTLRAEVNATVPGRNKAKDGWIGDPDHQDRASRHNPNDHDVVCAWDCTNDPAAGLNIHMWVRRYFEAVIRREVAVHPELEYVISAGEVFKRKNGWKAESYHGADDHDGHAHFAVGLGPDSEPTRPYDSTISWGFASLLNLEVDDMYELNDRKRDDLTAFAVNNIIMPAVGRIELALASSPGSLTKEDLAAIEKLVKDINSTLTVSGTLTVSK